MIFNLKKIHLFVLILLSALYFLSSGCGQSEGYANSGTLNSYNFVYFGSLGSSTINSYYLNKEGSLVVAASSIATGGGTSNINDFTAVSNANFLYAANKASNNISIYSLDSMTTTDPGAATYISVEAAGSGVSSVALHPNGQFLYATNSTALTDNISFFNVNSQTGALNSADRTYSARTNPTELAFTPNGRHLFVINRGTSDISSYSVNALTGALTTIDLSVSTGTNPEDLLVHPNGNFLYTLSVGAERLYQYSTSEAGLLTALTPAYVATGSGPKKMVITPNGKYVFVTNNTDNTFSAYSVDSTTGLLTALSFSPILGPTGAGVYSLTVTSDSKYLVVGGGTDSKGYVFEINDSTGNLVQVGSAVELGGSNPRTVFIVPLSVVE